MSDLCHHTRHDSLDAILGFFVFDEVFVIVVKFEFRIVSSIVFANLQFKFKIFYSFLSIVFLLVSLNLV